MKQVWHLGVFTYRGRKEQAANLKSHVSEKEKRAAVNNYEWAGGNFHAINKTLIGSKTQEVLIEGKATGGLRLRGQVPAGRRWK